LKKKFESWGISSAGRAPALQAGGRRFDPVILHHLSVRTARAKFINAKHPLGGCFVLVDSFQLIIGCSLKIHRVKSVLLAETAHS
jgi:hypothetical protein